MDINARVEFAADPARTFEMLTTQEFLEEVCRTSEATSYTVVIDGSTTRTTRDLPAPDVAKKLTGPTLTVEEEIVWGEAGADGSRQGKVAVKVSGQPAKMDGDAKLIPGGAGTVVEVSGDLKVNVPLMGKKIEKMAAPMVIEGIEIQSVVGKKWLAEH